MLVVTVTDIYAHTCIGWNPATDEMKTTDPPLNNKSQAYNFSTFFYTFVVKEIIIF